MVTIALKSEALFAIIGVGAVLVTVCVAAALCYTCQRRGRRSEEGGGKQGEVTEDITLTDLPARARSRRNAGTDRRIEEGAPKEMLPPVDVEEQTKMEASATSLRFKFEPPGELPTTSTTTLLVQPRFSQSARLDPQLFQQTFSTYESLYRAQSETSTSVPSSPHSATGAWPSQPAARTREASRLTNVTLADIALPPTPTKLSMSGSLTAAAQEPDYASLTTTSAPPQRSRTRRPMPDIIPPLTAGSPRRHAFPASEAPPSPRPVPTAGAGGSALASRPRSRSVGSSTVPPPVRAELRGAGQKHSPPMAMARARSAAAKPGPPKRSLDGGGRPMGGLGPAGSFAAGSASASASSVLHLLHVGSGQPRSFFHD